MTTSFGRYELLELLGRGGMGEVYRAHDTATDRIVALKLLPTHLADDPTYQERFRREARTAAGLNDPHVVPIHSYGEIDGRLYVDMRLVEGRDLGALITEQGGRLTPTRAVAILEQIATALDTAHRAGLVHRDIKPSNILIAEHDFAYLIDFGIARTTTDTAMTNTGQTIGTLAYMAPERFNGHTDPRSDIYALTCVLYECLTGAHPYPGDTLEQQLAGHLNTPPPQPSATGLPQAFDTVIAHGLAKNPDHRYQTATQLAHAARDALTAPTPASGPAATAHPPTQLAPQRRTAPASQASRSRTAATPRQSTLLRAIAGPPLLLALLVGSLLWAFVSPGRPMLGIDLAGGTQVILTPRTADGAAPTRAALAAAETVLYRRAPGATVAADGNELVITVPGVDSVRARNLAQAGLLYLRPVMNAIPAGEAGPVGLPGMPGAPPEQPGMPGMPGAPSAQPEPAGAPPADQPENPAPEPSPGPPDQPQDRASRIAMAKKLRQSDNKLIQMLALRIQAPLCGKPDYQDILAGNDDPTLPLVTCSQDGGAAYLLAPSIISGDQIRDATSAWDQQSGGYIVELRFKSDAADTWADYTASHIGTQISFTLDTRVLSAPQIAEAIPGGRTQIGGSFTKDEAQNLADVLRAGPLGLSFAVSEATAVSPLVGPRTLWPTVLGGAFVLAALMIAAVARYRKYGVIGDASLAAWAAMTFTSMWLVGGYLDYVLSLPGVFGLILALVVMIASLSLLFSRIRAETDTGRPQRLAVHIGWRRAGYLIVFGNAALALVAVVLYLLPGRVITNFAVTFGLGALASVLVLVLLTWPLLHLTAKAQVSDDRFMTVGPTVPALVQSGHPDRGQP